MSGLLDWTERGLLGLDAAVSAAGRGLDRLAGAPEPRHGDPEADAPGVDDLTSEWTNGALRTALRSWWWPSSWPGAGREMASSAVEATRRGLEGRSPGGRAMEWAAWPLRLPLSMAGLMTQEGLRALITARAVPASELADFTGFVLEIFSDLDVYFPLRYGQELDRWRRRVERDPDNARARLELGRTLLKCGLFDEAAGELRRAGEAARGGLRAEALFQALVASSRAGDLAAAFAAGDRCLDADPEHEPARHWLFLTAQKAGGYPARIAPNRRLEPRDGRHPTTLRYREVAAEIGLAKVSGGRGTAVADFFGDGRLHVAVAGAHSGINLFRNRGDGTFDDVSLGSGLESCVYSFALSAVDYDNDGRVDLFVTSLGFYGGRSRLFHNEGDGRFREVTREVGLGGWGPAFTATWADTTGDGLLDLFVAHNLGGLFDRKTPNRLYRNQGDGTFRDATREAGLHTPWPTLGACFGDFSGGGDPDLFVSGLGRAQLNRNRGDGTFEDVSRAAGVDAPAIGSVAMALDLDDSGRLDIVQATYSRPRDAIYTLRHGHGPPNGSPTRILRNLGPGKGGVPRFEDASRQWGLTGCWGTMSLAAGDVDNSGRQSLFLGNGDPSMDRAEASVLLHNDGETLRNVTFTAGLPFHGKGHGVNCADLAGDGRLHLLVAQGGLYPGDLASTEVHRPDDSCAEDLGDFLAVRLVGTDSNRDGIGARLALHGSRARGGRTQYRHVSGGSGFGWAPLQQHFGLGGAGAEPVGPLEIRWPSGRREQIDELPRNRTVEIIEGREGRRYEP